MPLWLVSIILGVVQGLTEFLPVSSSGHLAIGYAVLGVSRDVVLPFTVVLHLGTLTAVVVYFWNKIWNMIKASAGIFFPSKKTDDTNEVVYVLCATVITGVIALLLKHYVEEFVLNVEVVAVALMINGLFLLVSSRFRGKGKRVGLIESVVIGFFQGIAVIPGISRSGSTISAGLVMGVNGEKAAEFSFLLSVLAIAGAGVVEARDIANKTCVGFLPFALGFLSSAISGFVAIKMVFGAIRKGRFSLFGIYTFALGTVVLLFRIL